MSELTIQLKSQENGFRDYDISGHPSIYRIKVPFNVKQGEYVNVYYNESSKTCIRWEADVESTIKKNGYSTEFIFDYKSLYGKFVRMDDRFESVHIWNEQLYMQNSGYWVPHEITAQEFISELRHEWNSEYRKLHETYVGLAADIGSGIQFSFQDYVLFKKQHTLDAVYTMGNRDGSVVECKVAYFPLHCTYDEKKTKDGTLISSELRYYKDLRALVEIAVPGGIDFREVPVHFLTRK